jgi:hypothetical protein
MKNYPRIEPLSKKMTPPEAWLIAMTPDELNFEDRYQSYHTKIREKAAMQEIATRMESFLASRRLSDSSSPHNVQPLPLNTPKPPRKTAETRLLLPNPYPLFAVHGAVSQCPLSSLEL